MYILYCICFCFTRSQVANGDVEEQSGVNNERDVSSKQSGLRSSGGKNSHKANSNPEQQPLVTLSDVKSTNVISVCDGEYLC